MTLPRGLRAADVANRVHVGIMGAMTNEAEANLRRGNDSFYRSNPADYLETKLNLLVLAGARHVELGQMLMDGVEYAGIRIGPGLADPSSEEVAGAEVGDDDFDRYFTIESQRLLHHACETALRLFLVHASGSRTPWIEMNRDRSFPRFKKAVRATFVDGSPDPEAVALVCLGSRGPRESVTAEEWDEAVASITAFLKAFAVCILDDAELYNGIKHGLGVTAGDAVLIVEDSEIGAGPSVEYPVSSDWDAGGNRTWSVRTRWLDRTWSLGMVKVAINLIRTIWALGHYRHAGGPASGPVWFPGPFTPDNIRSAHRLGGRHMTWHLATEHDPNRRRRASRG